MLQIDAYKKQLFELRQVVTRLEDENIKLTDYLLQCNGDELKSIGKMLCSQFGDEENLDETNFMNVDLDDLNSGWFFTNDFSQNYFNLVLLTTILC